jgi:hypothetical protein
MHSNELVLKSGGLYNLHIGDYLVWVISKLAEYHHFIKKKKKKKRPTACSWSAKQCVKVDQFILYNTLGTNFMLCWPSIPIYACNETNLMHYLSSVCSVTVPLHISGFLVAHHQEVTMYICDHWYVLYVLVDCRCVWTLILPRPADGRLRHTTSTSGHIYLYTLLPPDDGLLESPKHVEV